MTRGSTGAQGRSCRAGSCMQFGVHVGSAGLSSTTHTVSWRTCRNVAMSINGSQACPSERVDDEVKLCAFSASLQQASEAGDGLPIGWNRRVTLK